MRFLLLHGSWHGAWCWHKVLPILRAEGHSATAIDLPGRGRHPGNPALIGLDTMVKAASRSLDASEKTTIVAHSRNGIVASALAYRFPERISRVIFLAAFMLPDGKRVLDYLPDPNSLLTGQVEVNRAGLWDWLRPQAYREALYADCSEADIELARALLTREPVRPALTKLTLGGEIYRTLPKAFVRLTQDQAVSLALQDRLINEAQDDVRVESLEAGHSAYFSRPEALAQTFIKLTRD